MTSPRRFHWDMHSLAWTLAIIAVSAAYLWFVGRPHLRRIRELSRNVNQQNAELAAQAESLQTLSQAHREVNLLFAQVSDFAERIPAEPDLGGFLEDIARLVQKRELQSDAMQPGEPTRTPEVGFMPISIKVHGSFAGVHGLIHDLEQMRRLTRIEQFHVSKDAEQPGVVKAELTLKVFYGAGFPGARTG